MRYPAAPNVGHFNLQSTRKKNITGKRIKEIRIRLGLSQDQHSGQLARRRISIDRAGISKIETGIRGVYDFEFKAFSRILKVSADWLLGG